MVHQYKLNGYNIVLDSESGCIHTVDDAAYDAIALYENTPAEEIISTISQRYDISEADVQEILDDIETLKKDHQLFTKDLFSGQAGLFKERQSVVKAICLHVAHACNMTCEYCFAGKGEYHGEQAIMSYEVGKRALDWLIENSGTRRNLEVDFFGGEPLLNFDVVKQLVAYGRSQEKIHDKNFRFTLTTNGMLLDDEVIEFANREMSNVVISLDGRKNINDKVRRTHGDEGTYDMILPAFKKLADSRDQQNYYVRGTYTHYNTDFADDILHMADLGFKELSIEPVVAPADAPYALQESDIPKLLSEYERLACEMLEECCPKAAAIMEEAEVDALAYLDFPCSHWKRLRTNNVQERTNREIKRRSRVVQVFPSVRSLERLAGAVMCEEDELWSDKRYFAESKIAELYDEKRAKQKPQPPTPEQEEELRLIAKKAIEASLELADELEAA